MILSFIMIKPFKPATQYRWHETYSWSAMPQYEMPMTEARPSAPEHAKPIEMNDLGR